MTALEIAKCFELYACDHKPDGWPAIRQDTLNNAATLLRSQHEAIVKLRAALENYVRLDGQAKKFFDSGCNAAAEIIAQKALKDTEDLK